MERINIESLITSGTINITDNCSVIINKSTCKNLNKIIVEDRVNCDILFAEIVDSGTFEIIAKDNSQLTVKGLINGSDINLAFKAKTAQNATISMHFIDFSCGKTNIDAVCDMDEQGSFFSWQMASLAAHKDDKKIRVNVEHNVPYLNGDVSNYGVCKDNAKLEIAGTTHIANGASKTLTKQNARIMLIDGSSRGIAKPILKIDENDVKASHGATLGQINEEHLFYLKSRGLSEAEAKRLIVLGYFNPVVLLFKDEECEQYIMNLVEERI